MARSNRHKANNALGAFCICVLFALETTQIAHLNPHPATPYVRVALGLCTVLSLALFFHYRRKAGKDGA